jgi:hypothetical protein
MINLKQASEWATVLGVVSGFLTSCFYLVRWIVMWMWRVDKIVTNHVPHMEKMLKLICKKMKIDYEGPEGE